MNRYSLTSGGYQHDKPLSIYVHLRLHPTALYSLDSNIWPLARQVSVFHSFVRLS